VPKYNKKNRDFELLDRRKRIASLYCQGLSQKKIAAQVGVSMTLIHYELQEVRKEWLASAVGDFNERKAQELAKLDETERLAMRSFLRSMKDAEEKTVTKTEMLKQFISKNPRTGEKELVEKVVPSETVEEFTTRGQCGDPRFLQVVTHCIELRAKITGLMKNDQNNFFLIDYDKLVAKEREIVGTGTGVERDPVEERVFEGLGYNPNVGPGGESPGPGRTETPTGEDYDRNGDPSPPVEEGS
jgi:transposase